MTISAHFDGKVIVPDEPVNLPVNQPVVLQIQTIGKKERAEDESALGWLLSNAVENDTLPADLADEHDHYLMAAPKRTSSSSDGLFR